MAWTVYVLQSESSGGFYVGSTGNPCRRVHDHNAGLSPSTRGRGPWKLVYQEDHATRSEAVAREKHIKAMKSRKYVESLIESAEGSRTVAER